MTAEQSHAFVDRRWVLTSCCGGLIAVAGCTGNGNDQENAASDQQDNTNEEPTRDLEILNASSVFRVDKASERRIGPLLPAHAGLNTRNATAN